MIAFLGLAHNNVADGGAEALAALVGAGGRAARRRPNALDLTKADDLVFEGGSCPLTALDLTGNKIRTKGAKALGRALRYHDLLNSLGLAANHLGSAGGAAILEALVQPDAEAVLAAKAYESYRGGAELVVF